MALERLRELHGRLESEGGPEGDAAVTECERLLEAVEAFHMEAIRFRMYGLHRRVTSDSAAVSPETLQILEDARADLVAAGFKVR